MLKTEFTTKLINYIMPHGLWLLIYRIQRGKHAAAVANIDKAVSRKGQVVIYKYSDSIEFIFSRGVPRHHLIEGSIPYESLIYAEDKIVKEFAGAKIHNILHVGNFVGISLAYCCSMCERLGAGIVIAIDPNMEHRGIVDPQNHVCALLERYGYSDRTLLICGYSANRNLKNDGVVFEPNGTAPTLMDVDHAKGSISQIAAPSNVLQNLTVIAPRSISVAMIDGNHDSEYVIDELKRIYELLSENAIVVLDDISPSWPGLEKIYKTNKVLGYVPVGTDGRVGLLRKNSGTRLLEC